MRRSAKLRGHAFAGYQPRPEPGRPGVPQVRQAAEPFASKPFPRTPKLLGTEPSKALVIGAFVRGLSMREVESLFEQAGPGKLSKSTASRMCEDLEERFDAFKRRDLYDVRLALFRVRRSSLCTWALLRAWSTPSEAQF